MEETDIFYPEHIANMVLIYKTCILYLIDHENEAFTFYVDDSKESVENCNSGVIGGGGNSDLFFD